LGFFRLGELDDTGNWESLSVSLRGIGKRKVRTYPHPFDIPLGNIMISEKTTFPAVDRHSRESRGRMDA
jgi:hypothetical protein